MRTRCGKIKGLGKSNCIELEFHVNAQTISLLFSACDINKNYLMKETVYIHFVCFPDRLRVPGMPIFSIQKLTDLS
jgi:hypothetical protein